MSQVRVQLPVFLKQKLLEDWDRIQRGSIASLPRRPSVNDVLLQYVDSCKTSNDLVEPEEEVQVGVRLELLLHAEDDILASKFQCGF